MTGVYEKAIASFTAEKRKSPETYKFLENLMYGTLKQSPSNATLKHYNFYFNRISQCLIYLHENHIGVLVCVDKSMTGLRAYFNIKNIDISEFSSEYELDKNIEKNKCTNFIKSDIVLKQKQDIVVLVFEDIINRNNFKDDLEKLKKVFSPIPDSYDPLILKAFIKADTNQNGEISWTELKNLVRMMKVNLDKKNKEFVKKILGKEKIQTVQFSQFQSLWKIFYCRNQLIDVFQKYNNEEFHSLNEYLAPKLDIKEFKRFLMEEQKQTQEESENIVKRMYENENYSLSFYDFCHYVFGPNNNLLNDDYRNKKINQKKPLNHYYCYSSHNTYLTGDQLFSDSRVERYLVDLQNGLRCVQIDVHDGSQGPIVKHGYTPTSSIRFQDVIQTIKRFISLNPEHSPIILSLEVHCNCQNQQKMADILLKNFDKNMIQVDEKKKFPTLEECKGKIIVKGPGDIQLFKRNQNQFTTLLDGQLFQDEEVNYPTEEFQFQSEFQQIKQLSNTYKNARNAFSQCLLDLEKQKKEHFRKQNQFKKVKRDPTKIQETFQNKLLKKTRLEQNSSKKLQNQTYHEQYKVSGKLLQLICMLSKGKQQDPCCWQSKSFSQNKILSLYNNPKTFDQTRTLSTQKWFRSYPDGLRILSSNYDPIPALQLGIQIVAINTQQKNDVNHHILKSFFMRNQNRCTGYREKVYVQKKSEKTENNRQKKNDRVMTNVEIKFISGLRIYQNEENEMGIPPVEVKAYFTGTKRDNIRNKALLMPREYTEIVYDQAFNPKFNLIETMEIKCCDPELGFLIVEISECGRSVIPIDSIKHGWRVISLYNDELKEKESKLLCYIELTKTSMLNDEEDS